jgi:hypothetical protein
LETWSETALTVCNAAINVGERGRELGLARRMCRAIERADNFFARKLQRFQLSRKFRIRYGRPSRLAISLKLFYAFLNPSFVVD